MGDEFDECECAWSHEFAMQRLLAFIRQNQNHCTDTDCIDVSGRLLQNAPASVDDSSCFTITAILMLLAMFMYVIRPNTLLNLTTTKRHRRNRDNDDAAPPPPPPPSAPPAVN